MNNNYKQITLIISLCIIFTSCMNDEDIYHKNLTGSWQKELIETRISGQAWTQDERDCWRDDMEEFSGNGIWRLYDGTMQCSPGSGITSGTWTLASEGKKIIFTYDAFSGEYESTVESLSDKTLILSHGAGDMGGTQYRTTYSKI